MATDEVIEEDLDVRYYVREAASRLHRRAAEAGRLFLVQGWFEELTRRVPSDW